MYRTCERRKGFALICNFGAPRGAMPAMLFLSVRLGTGQSECRPGRVCLCLRSERPRSAFAEAEAGEEEEEEEEEEEVGPSWHDKTKGGEGGSGI